MSGWRSVALVAQREIRERGRTKAYLGSTLLVLVLIVALVGLATVGLGEDETHRIGPVGDVPSDVGVVLELAGAVEGGVSVEPTRPADVEAAEADLLDGELDAVLVGDDELVVHERVDEELSGLVEAAVRQVRLAERLVEAGVSAEEVSGLLGAGRLVTVRALEPETTEEEAGGLLVTSIGLILLLMAIMLYGQWVLMGVVEEKSSRIVEVHLGTIRPHHLLAGKVLGLGLLGLAQVVVLVAVGGSAALLADVGELPPTTGALAVSVIFWFVAGYALYSVAFDVVGATVSRHEDASNASTPVTMVIMATHFVSLFVLVRDPDGLLARVLSVLPPFSPMAMPARVGVGDPALWETLLAVVLVVPACYGLLRLGGRLYTGAVLRTGPRVHLADAWRSAREVDPSATASGS